MKLYQIDPYGSCGSLEDAKQAAQHRVDRLNRWLKKNYKN